jgi:hypothetical protein
MPVLANDRRWVNFYTTPQSVVRKALRLGQKIEWLITAEEYPNLDSLRKAK